LGKADDGYFSAGLGACIFPSWYLATEMQVFLFTPFILLPTYWLGRHFGKLLAASFLCMLLAASTAIAATMSAIREWPITPAITM